MAKKKVSKHEKLMEVLNSDAVRGFFNTTTALAANPIGGFVLADILILLLRAPCKATQGIMGGAIFPPLSLGRGLTTLHNAIVATTVVSAVSGAASTIVPMIMQTRGARGDQERRLYERAVLAARK